MPFKRTTLFSWEICWGGNTFTRMLRDEKKIQIKREICSLFHLNQSQWMAGWDPTMSGPTATGGRLDTTISTVQIHFEIWEKYILQFKTNIFSNFRQIHKEWTHGHWRNTVHNNLNFANTYYYLTQIILQFKTNTRAVDPWPLVEDWTQQSQLCKYIWQFATNLFCNLRQIHKQWTHGH